MFINNEYQPILSLDTSIALGIVTLRDCDVFSLTISSHSNEILEDYKYVFEDYENYPESTKSSLMKLKNQDTPPKTSADCTTPLKSKKNLMSWYSERLLHQ